jgi:hypothetical protein
MIYTKVTKNKKKLSVLCAFFVSFVVKKNYAIKGEGPEIFRTTPFSTTYFSPVIGHWA